MNIIHKPIGFIIRYERGYSSPSSILQITQNFAFITSLKKQLQMVLKMPSSEQVFTNLECSGKMHEQIIPSI